MIEREKEREREREREREKKKKKMTGMKRGEDGARPAEGWFHQTHKWQLLISSRNKLDSAR